MYENPPLYEVFVFWTRTGEVVDQFSYLSWSYTDSVQWSEPGTLSVTVPILGNTDIGRINKEALKSVSREMRNMSLVLVRDGRALAAGPVFSLGWTATEITIQCSSIVKLLDYRLVMNPSYLLDPLNPASDLKYTLTDYNLTIQLINMGTTGTNRELPLIVPPQDNAYAAPEATITYAGKDFGTYMERITEITDQDDGPDVHIIPNINADKTLVNWIVNIGQPRIGSLTPVAVWDFSSAIDEITGDIDDSERVSTGYVVGDNADAGWAVEYEMSPGNRLVGIVQTGVNAVYGIPSERVDRTSSASKTQGQINLLAASYVDKFSTPKESWTINVLPEKWPIIGDHWSLGDVVSIDVRDHPWIDDGTYDRRIIKVNHSSSTMGLGTISA